MSDLFVNEDAEIQVNICVGNNKSGNIVADESVDLLKQQDEDIDVTAVKEYHIFFKQPSFKDSVPLASDVFNYSVGGEGGGGEVDFNPVASRYSKMIKLIKRWTLVDSDGKPIPADEEHISALHPVVANAIGLQLDAAAPTF